MPNPTPDSAGPYRELVDSSPDAIVLLDDSQITFANPSAVRLLGATSAGQLAGRAIWDVLPAHTHPVVREELACVTSAAAHRTRDIQITTSSGATIDLEVTAARVPSVGSKSVQVVLRDVTAAKRDEAALRENEERLRLAFAGADEGVWDWDLKSGAVVYSRRWKEMLGYTDEEIGPHVRAWEGLLHPDDKSWADQLYEGVVHRQQRYEGEFRLRHKHGHYITVLTRGLAVRDVSGRVVRIVGTHLDITERKRTESALRESEERLRLAFDGALEGVWDWNLETNAVVYSPRWKHMLGYSDEEIEPHISAWERLVHPEDRVKADEAADRVARGAPTYQAEFRLRHKRGHYIDVLSRGFPIRRDPAGPVVRIVGTHFDLTERKRTEAERARNELLGRLVFAHEEERRRIARDMHDQFGEQLTALGLRVSRLKAACEHYAELREGIEALEAITQHLDDDVEQLVWQLRPTALDDLGLYAALSNYVRDWSDRTHVAAGIHASGEWHNRLRSEIETTVYRIAQEALNNIAKHARATRVDIILDRRPDGVVLIVEDNGIGFDPADPERHGFGLVGIRERAALVGAAVEIESAPGQGTTILLRIGGAVTGTFDHA